MFPVYKKGYNFTDSVTTFNTSLNSLKEKIEWR